MASKTVFDAFMYIPAATDRDDTDDSPTFLIGLHIQSVFLILSMDGLRSGSWLNIFRNKYLQAVKTTRKMFSRVKKII